MLDSKLIRGIIIEEKRWFRLLNKKGETNDSCTPSHWVMRIRVIAAIFSILYVSKFWKKRKSHCVFVSFGEDAIAASSSARFPEKYINANAGLTTLFFKNRSLLELESIYILINYKNIFNKKIRKLLLYLYLQWLDEYLPFLEQNIYFVKQDYSGISSVLVTLSHLTTLKVVGLQHGLMKFNNLESSIIYPNYRTKNEWVYSSSYAEVLRCNKSPSSIVAIIGPPFDCGSKKSIPNSTKLLVFVSSADLFYKNRVLKIEDMQRCADNSNLNFLVRPHPHERHILSQFSFQYDLSTVDDIINNDPKNTIFIGFYSTLLYWAACSGFKTVWIKNDGFEDSSRDQSFISNLPNSYIVDEVSENFLVSLFNMEPIEVKEDFIYERMDEMIRKSFPNFEHFN